MGQDKAFATVDGIPLVSRTAQVLEQCDLYPIHLVGKQARLHTLGLPVFEDGTEQQHPLFGVAAALQHHPKAFVFIVPCDLVNLQVQHVHAMLRSAKPCVARSDGRIHPLMGLFPGNLAREARWLANKGSASARLVADFTVVDLPKPFLVDANVPEQLPR